uniref:Uncharacterized protein n=1 Tax=Castor canadensis TaxID=51338 RepID=A0A8C0X6Q0_CASCN
MEEWTILLNFNPKLASPSPVSSACSRPSGVRVRSFSREPSTRYWECLMRKMVPCGLGFVVVQPERQLFLSRFHILFGRLIRDSGSRLSQLGSQTHLAQRPRQRTAKSTAAEPPTRPPSAPHHGVPLMLDLKAWFISPPCPHPLPYHPLHPPAPPLNTQQKLFCPYL